MSRIRKLIEKLKEKDLDFALIFPGANFRYLTGATIETYERFCTLIIDLKNEDATVVVPKLDELKIKGKGINYFAYTDNENPLDYLKRIIQGSSLKVGTEENMPIKYYLILKKFAKEIEISVIDDVVREMRVIKDEEELANISKAVRIIEDSIKETEDKIKEGITENELASYIYQEILKRNANPMNLLIQFAENSAIPHWRHSSKSIKRGDIIVIDVSATYNEYFGDLTRTYSLGNPNYNEFFKIYEIVKEAHDEAILASKDGILASDLDEIARSVITKKGYGNYFIHRTGHGLGLEVHEEPFINGLYKKELKKGMVFTIEPGIYLPGKFGVRLESNVYIDSNGKAVSLDSYWPSPILS
ncbi:MAG: Xaa-Pro peptidase family protein [Thermoproteota archaeon]|jgi:Xaa-Pro aminopeptidase